MLTEILYEVGDKLLQRIDVNWQQASRAMEYEVEYKLGDDNFERAVVSSTGFQILNSKVGTYSVSVNAIGS